jgi:hypothetical protein
VSEYCLRPKLSAGLNIPRFDICLQSFVVRDDVPNPLVNDGSYSRRCNVLRESQEGCAENDKSNESCRGSHTWAV